MTINDKNNNDIERELFERRIKELNITTDFEIKDGLDLTIPLNPLKLWYAIMFKEHKYDKYLEPLKPNWIELSTGVSMQMNANFIKQFDLSEWRVIYYYLCSQINQRGQYLEQRFKHSWDIERYGSNENNSNGYMRAWYYGQCVVEVKDLKLDRFVDEGFEWKAGMPMLLKR